MIFPKALTNEWMPSYAEFSRSMLGSYSRIFMNDLAKDIADTMLKLQKLGSTRAR